MLIKAFATISIGVAVVALGSSVRATDAAAHITWSDASGNTYYLSTGSSSGSCWSSPDTEGTIGEAGCTGLSGYATVHRDGCGDVSQQGTCNVLLSRQDATPLGT